MYKTKNAFKDFYNVSQEILHLLYRFSQNVENFNEGKMEFQLINSFSWEINLSALKLEGIFR